MSIANAASTKNAAQSLLPDRTQLRAHRTTPALADEGREAEIGGNLLRTVESSTPSRPIRETGLRVRLIELVPSVRS